MEYNLNDLKNFVFVCNFKTVSEAARTLGVSQPSLSQSIKKLEADLDIKLFYRTKMGISLTPDGKELFKLSKVALHQLNDISLFNKKSIHLTNKHITIGCHSTIASYALPKAISDLNQIMPELQFHFRHASSNNVQELIQFGKLDLGIVVNPIETQDIVIKEICKDLYSVWAYKEKISLNKIICNREILSTQLLLNGWKNHPQRFIHSESFDFITRLTSSGIGYGIIPERAVKLTGEKLFKQHQFPSFSDRVCLVYRPEFGKNTINKTIINSIVKNN